MTLTGGLGCFPLDNEPYHSLSDSQKKVIGIRSLTEFGNSLRAPSSISALPPILHLLRLALKLFRREPAISMFDWLFTPTHTSDLTLTGGLGCFPLDNEPYHSLSDSQKKVIGIRSLTEFGNSLRAPSSISALPPILHLLRLALKLFRREPAISMFDWLFTPTHT